MLYICILLLLFCYLFIFLSLNSTSNAAQVYTQVIQSSDAFITFSKSYLQGYRVRRVKCSTDIALDFSLYLEAASRERFYFLLSLSRSLHSTCLQCWACRGRVMILLPSVLIHSLSLSSHFTCVYLSCVTFIHSSQHDT